MPKPPPPAPKGNQRGIILKDAEIRQIAYKDFCQHIADGYPQECWSFSQDGYRCHFQTMLSYIKGDISGEFDPNLKKEAHCKAYKKLYGEGLSLMRGQYKNGSPVVWQTVMRNVNRRFGWDTDIIEENKTHVQRLAESIRNEPVLEAETDDQRSE